MTYDLQYREYVMAFSMLLVCKCKCNVNVNANLYSASAKKNNACNALDEPSTVQKGIIFSDALLLC